MKAKIIGRTISVLVLFISAVQLHAEDGAQSPHKPSGKAWKSDRKAGKEAVEHHKYAEAEQYYKAAVEDARSFGAKDDRLAETLEDLGDVYASTREFEAAEPIFRELAEIRQGDPNARLEANTLLEYGHVLRANRNWPDAVTTYQRLVEVLRRLYGSEDHPIVAQARLMLADVYFGKGDYAQAEPLAKRCANTFQHPSSGIVMRQNDPATYGLQTFRRVFRPNYENALEALSILDAIYVIQARSAEAAEGLQNCLKVIDANSNGKEPVVPEMLGRLGQVYLANSNYPGAETIFIRLTAIQEKNLGATNSATHAAENELAQVYAQEHKTAKAEAVYQKVLQTDDQALGVDSSDSAGALAKLGRFYLEAGDYEKAAPEYARLRQHAEKFQGLDVALTPILADQAVIFMKLGKDEELAGVYRQQAAVFEKMFGADSRALIKPLTNEAAVLRKLKRDAEADALEKRVAAIQGR